MSDNKGLLILPGDPDFNGDAKNTPIHMADPYEAALTPKTAALKRSTAMDEAREKANLQPFKYASTSYAHAPDAFMKSAQAAGVSNIMANPMWFSPLHTAQNWQIASKRREVYQWTFINNCQIMTYDYIYKHIKEITHTYNEEIIDQLTGGVIHNNIDCESICDGLGNFEEPIRYFERPIDNKRCFSFRSYGNWRSIDVTEEHKLLVLDGEKYRHYKKLETDRKARMSRGIPPGGDKPRLEVGPPFIDFKKAEDIVLTDLLLCPIPKCGSLKIDRNIAWLIGVFIADGTKSSQTASFTMDRNEAIRPELEKLLTDRFKRHNSDIMGKVSSFRHGDGNGWRVTVSTKESIHLFSNYVTGIKTAKRFTGNIFDLDSESRLHVLGGYFDGDGYFDPGMKLVANNYSKDMADQIYWLCLSVGIRISLGKYKVDDNHYKTDSEWYYKLSIPSHDVRLLQKYMRGNKIPVDFQPKQERQLRFFYNENGTQYFAQPLSKITQFNYSGTGYDLEIKPTHSLVVNGYIASNCRFFYENEPKVAAAIDFYSRFPMNSFELECPNEKIKDWFQHNIIKRLRLNEQFKMISSEYFMLGDVFIHLDVECEQCGGSGVDPDNNEQCNHKNGTFRKLIILNPDWVEVQQSVMADDPVIKMIPDEELKRIIMYKQPKEIYDRIPMAIKKLVVSGQPIPLSSRTVSHLKHMGTPYGTYGTSLIRRLFTTLAYKTKIMTANWIVAERLILPVRVVKVGSENQPATSVDIADIQQQLAATANDPNLTIITHHNFDYEWYGCLTDDDSNSYVITKYGRKHYKDLTDKDEIATVNSNSEVQFNKVKRQIEFTYNKTNSETGKIFVIGNKDMVGKFTPNHKHCLQGGIIKRSDELEIGDILVSANLFDLSEKLLTEGSQKTNNVEISFEITIIKEEDYSGTVWCLETSTGNFFVEIDGHIILTGNSSGKILQVTQELEHIDKEILDGFMLNQSLLNGEMCLAYDHEMLTIDGYKPVDQISLNDNICIWDDDKEEYYWETPKEVFKYDNVEYIYEIKSGDTVLLKCSENHNIVLKTVHGHKYKHFNITAKELYEDYVHSGGSEMLLLPGAYANITEINKVEYNRSVYCVETSTGFFFARYKDVEFISSNSGYQSAQVGVETLIRRIESWRHTLAEWCEDRIFRPIAEMQGFIDEEASKDLGRTVYLYPKIKWNDLNLKDKNQWFQILLQLFQIGIVSQQTLCEEMELDYDQEVERRRYEMTQAGPGAGGAGGSMPGMGGGAGGGGMGMGADPMGGGAGGMGAPGMGGADGGMMGGGGAGGAPPGGGAGPMAQGQKILKKGKSGKQNEEEVAPAVPMNLTSIEQSMAKMLEKVGTNLGWNQSQIYQNIRLQFPIENPRGHKPFTLDFALPKYKIGIEADGSFFHGRPEEIAANKDRDGLLAQRGWTILRYTDKVINKTPQKVESSIYSYIKKAMDMTKTASNNNEHGSSHLFVPCNQSHWNSEYNMIDLYEAYAKDIQIGSNL